MTACVVPKLSAGRDYIKLTSRNWVGAVLYLSLGYEFDLVQGDNAGRLQWTI